jgi:hypothetical protein
MKWAELTPAERDALIAEKVMGVTDFRCTGTLSYDGDNTLYRHRYYVCQQCKTRLTITEYYLEKCALPTEHTKPIPAYSESMDAAMLVVREMNRSEDGTCERYDNFVNAFTSIVGSDMFFDLFYCDPDPTQDHLTPARICLAGLRTVGVEDKP